MNRLLFPTFVLDLDAQQLLCDGQAKRLRPKTWSVLVHLAQNPGRVVTKQELLDNVWSDVAVSDDMPRICVGELRSALGDRSRSPALIETVHGKGYRLLVEPKRDRSRRSSVAVLPFEPMEKDDEDVAELAELLGEAVSMALGRIGGIEVAGTRSVLLAAARDGDLRSRAEALGTDHVLRGGMTIDGEGVLLQAELVDAVSGEVGWRRQFSISRDRFVGLEEEIARAVGEALSHDDDPPTGAIRLQRPRAADAYHLYLRGLRLQNLFESEHWRRAAECYRRASELDPDYAPPLAGLASILVLQANAGTGDSASLFRQAYELASRAAALDPDLAEAHCQLGSVEMLHRWDFAEAERRFRTSLTLGPSSSVAYFSYQRLLSFLGRHDEARAAGQRAFELDPLSPVMIANRGFADTVARRPEAALAVFEEALEDQPDNTMARLGSVAALRDLGRWDEALARAEGCRDRIHGSRIPSLIAHTLALAGRESEARSVLDSLSRPGSGDVSRTHLALVHGALGELDRAFELLDEAFAARESNLVNLIDPAFDPLREDGRFRELVGRIGLPEVVARVP